METKRGLTTRFHHEKQKVQLILKYEHCKRLDKRLHGPFNLDELYSCLLCLRIVYLDFQSSEYCVFRFSELGVLCILSISMAKYSVTGPDVVAYS